MRSRQRRKRFWSATPDGSVADSVEPRKIPCREWRTQGFRTRHARRTARGGNLRARCGGFREAGARGASAPLGRPNGDVGGPYRRLVQPAGTHVDGSKSAPMGTSRRDKRRRTLRRRVRPRRKRGSTRVCADDPIRYSTHEPTGLDVTFVERGKERCLLGKEEVADRPRRRRAHDAHPVRRAAAAASGGRARPAPGPARGRARARGVRRPAAGAARARHRRSVPPHARQRRAPRGPGPPHAPPAVGRRARVPREPPRPPSARVRKLVPAQRPSAARNVRA